MTIFAEIEEDYTKTATKRQTFAEIEGEFVAKPRRVYRKGDRVEGYLVSSGYDKVGHGGAHAAPGVFDIGGNYLESRNISLDEAAAGLESKGYRVVTHRSAGLNSSGPHLHVVTPGVTPQKWIDWAEQNAPKWDATRTKRNPQGIMQKPSERGLKERVGKVAEKAGGVLASIGRAIGPAGMSGPGGMPPEMAQKAPPTKRVSPTSPTTSQKLAMAIAREFTTGELGESAVRGAREFVIGVPQFMGRIVATPAGGLFPYRVRQSQEAARQLMPGAVGEWFAQAMEPITGEELFEMPKAMWDSAMDLPNAVKRRDISEQTATGLMALAILGGGAHTVKRMFGKPKGPFPSDPLVSRIASAKAVIEAGKATPEVVGAYTDAVGQLRELGYDTSLMEQSVRQPSLSPAAKAAAKRLRDAEQIPQPTAEGRPAAPIELSTVKANKPYEDMNPAELAVVLGRLYEKRQALEVQPGNAEIAFVLDDIAKIEGMRQPEPVTTATKAPMVGKKPPVGKKVTAEPAKVEGVEPPPKTAADQWQELRDQQAEMHKTLETNPPKGDDLTRLLMEEENVTAQIDWLEDKLYRHEAEYATQGMAETIPKPRSFIERLFPRVTLKDPQGRPIKRLGSEKLFNRKTKAPIDGPRKVYDWDDVRIALEQVQDEPWGHGIPPTEQKAFSTWLSDIMSGQRETVFVDKMGNKRSFGEPTDAYTDVEVNWLKDNLHDRYRKAVGAGETPELPAVDIEREVSLPYHPEAVKRGQPGYVPPTVKPKASVKDQTALPADYESPDDFTIVTEKVAESKIPESGRAKIQKAEAAGQTKIGEVPTPKPAPGKGAPVGKGAEVEAASEPTRGVSSSEVSVGDVVRTPGGKEYLITWHPEKGAGPLVGWLMENGKATKEKFTLQSEGTNWKIVKKATTAATPPPLAIGDVRKTPSGGMKEGIPKKGDIVEARSHGVPFKARVIGIAEDGRLILNGKEFEPTASGRFYREPSQVSVLKPSWMKPKQTVEITNVTLGKPFIEVGTKYKTASGATVTITGVDAAKNEVFYKAADSTGELRAGKVTTEAASAWEKAEGKPVSPAISKLNTEADTLHAELEALRKTKKPEAFEQKPGERGATISPAEMEIHIKLAVNAIKRGIVTAAEFAAEMAKRGYKYTEAQANKIWAAAQVRRKAEEIPGKGEPIKFDEVSGFKAVSPESSIHQIEQQITQIRRKVKQRKVTQKAGREAIKKLKQEAVAMAEDAGIAVIGGKPIIRQSGFAGSAELVAAPTKDVYLRQSPLNTALTQDALPREGGELGPIYRLIHEPTQKAEASRLSWERQQTQRVRDILRENKIYGIAGQKHHGRVMRQIMETVPNEDLAALSPHQLVEKFPELGGGPEHFAAAKQLRGLFDEWREEANQVRTRLGKKEIPYRQTYAPHIEESGLWQTLVRGAETEIGDLPLDFIVPSQRINPHAYRRVGEMKGRQLNLYKLIDSYIPAISRDIFLTPAIENIKAQNAVLKARGLNRTAQYWDDYIKYNLVRQPTPLDIAVGAEPGTKLYAGLQKIQEVRIRGGILGNVLWSIAVQPTSVALTMKEVGMRKTIAGAMDWFTSDKLRKEIRQTSTSMQIKQAVEAGPAKQGIIDEFSAGVYRSPMKSWQDLAGAFISAEEYHLHGLSIAAGLRHGRKLGYKGENLTRYANSVGERTQSMYNAASRPMMLQSQVFRTAVPFQTFAFEMWGHLSEIAGKTGMPASARMRLGMAINLTVGIYLANEYSKKIRGTGSFSPSSFTPGIGPSVDVVTQYATEGRAPYQRIPIAPLEDARQLASGIYKFVNDKPGGGRELRRVLLLYGMGLAGAPGATQVNRTIDGLIAAEQGYWKTPSGRTAFPVEGADAWAGLLVGPYGTQAGKEYIKKMKSNSKNKPGKGGAFPEWKPPPDSEAGFPKWQPPKD